MDDSRKSEDDKAVEIPFDGTLDLHTFGPSEVKELVVEYLGECCKRGVLQVRIVHGKGTGTLRRTVHGVLSRMPEVDRFALANESGGGWGATIVTMRPIK